jgi:primosomal protein N' (replication factor Y)
VSRPTASDGHVGVCRVQPDVPAVHRAFDYSLPDALAHGVHIGTVVRVPLHGRRVRGWVLDPDVAAPEVEGARLRDVVAVVSAGPAADVVDLCRWAAWRWAGPLATLLRAASPPNVVPAGSVPERETAVYPAPPDAPSLDGGERLAVVSPLVDLAEPASAMVAGEGSTIVVDPDASRAARLVAALEQQGREVVVMRSDQPDAERTAAWDRARAGAHVVVGGRTAIFAPVPDLARVVVLDEADEALEEERAPTWNARDIAFERCAREGADIRVVTPAPTVDVLVALEETARGDAGRTRLRAAWPRTVVVDQRDEEPGHGLLSDALARELRRNVDEGRQALCVLNRRGRARLLACRTCRELARCERCGATVQERDGELVCARCDMARPLVCLHCLGTRFRAVRAGIARVRDDLAALLPRATVATVDASTVELPSADVLIGTEAVLHRARGPVGMVAFLELDQELLAPRARAAEQAMWLLVRAARLLATGGTERGPLLLQTRVPDHEVVGAARTGRPLVVAGAEWARREALAWPPFGGVAELSGERVAVRAACDVLAAVERVTVLGPVDDGTRALVRAATVGALADALARPDVDAAHALGRLRVDVDPRRA